MIHAVHNSLESMGVLQYLMAFLFLSTYSLSLGGFAGDRGRCHAVASAATAAIAFASLTDRWEHGVLLVLLTLVALGVFVGAAWALWALFGWRDSCFTPDTDLAQAHERRQSVTPSLIGGAPSLGALPNRGIHSHP